MPRTVDYYFSLLSPWAYIGHALFMDIVRRHRVTVNYKPVALAQVFADTGGLPLPKRHPARQRYRMFELQRWREKRGLALHLHPKFWPFDGNLADRFVIAAAREHDPDRFLRGGFAGIWEHERNLGEEHSLIDIARAADLPAVELLAAAKADAAQKRYEANVRDAVAAFAFFLGLAPVAQAQESTPETEHGRFTFKQVSDGLLRLDARTGEVALCGKRAVGWACQALPEDRTALENEIARLQGENAALKRELVARGVPLPDGTKGPPATARPDQDLKLPSDADLDRALSFLERAWRRLVEMVQNLQREMDSEKGKKQLDKGGPDKKS